MEEIWIEHPLYASGWPSAEDYPELRVGRYILKVFFFLDSALF